MSALTLSFLTPFDVYVFLFSSISLITLFSIQYTFVKSNVRHVSWILTQLSSMITCILSMVCIYHHFALNTHDSFTAAFAEDSLMTETKLSRAVTVFFISYVIHDLLIGVVFYRSEIRFLTGWMHHTIYTLLLLKVLQTHVCTGFAVALIMELPTALLSFQQTHKIGYDRLYGLLFFMFRLCYNLFMTYQVYVNARKYTFTWAAYTGAFLFHGLWFKDWVVFYIKKRRDRRIKQSL